MSIEQATFLSELEHRVRNDLQGIASLARSEWRRSDSEDSRDGFERIERRVSVLAALYELLLDTGAIGEIAFSDYLRDVCTALAGAADMSRREIVLSADLEDLRLDVARAVQLATATAQLVSNAAKHAFGRGQPGTITVALRRGRPGPSTLTIADDGDGFGEPEQRQPGRGRGLELARRIVSQAGGQLSRIDGSGTTWRIALHASSPAAL